MTHSLRYTIGVDEAGRGPLAGPLAVAAVAIPQSVQHRVLKNIQHSVLNTLSTPLRDSKQLTLRQRELWFEWLERKREEGALLFAVVFVGPRTIDSHGISTAARRGVRRALQALQLEAELCEVLLDGLLAAPRRFSNQRTIIRGDETEPLISLASIAAKVTRDRYMVRAAERYPLWGFAAHKGYGTSAHFAALRQYGLSTIHRVSFCGSSPVRHPMTHSAECDIG
jgi:ribonuclease HII